MHKKAHITAESLGLSVVNNGSVNCLAIDKNDTNDFIGVEYEIGYSHSIIKKRAIARALLAAGRVTREHLVSSEYGHSLLDYIIDSLNHYTPFLYKNIHYDGGGLEFSFLPFSLKAHQKAIPFYTEFMTLLRALSFTHEMGWDGIHMNIDYSMFGDDLKERSKTISNILWLGFRNSDFFTKMSGRVEWAESSADISVNIGDPFELLSETERLSRFLSRKQALLDALSANRYNGAFNVTVRNGGRQCMEVRWFGSTTDPIVYISRIEYMHSLIQYGKNRNHESEISLKDYVEFVTANVNKFGYMYLLDALSSNEYTFQYMVQGATAIQVEQPTIKTAKTLKLSHA